jgi:hypothetical protein
MAMRPQEALYLLLPGVECAWRVLRGPERRRWLVAGVVLCAATLVAFAPQLWVWRYYTGSFSPPQVEPIRWSEPMFTVALFSTRAGLFPWSPIVYASTLGVLLSVKRPQARQLTWALTALFLVNLYIVAGAWVPSGAYSYGARRLSDGAPLFGLGVALLYARLASLRARRLVLAFAALCVVLTLGTMELQRAGKTKSSGGFARSSGQYLAEFGAPLGLQRVADAIGYPFVQPAGWLFAARWRVPLASFEGVVGNFMLDRDGQWFTVLDKRLELDWNHRHYVADGLALASKPPALVRGPVRLLVSMFASERITVELMGTFAPDAQVALRWNGTPQVLRRSTRGFSFEVPRAQVRAGVNEVQLDAPVGSRIEALDFTGLDKWW